MEASLKVNADPAKSFFVSMLIKDITLRDAIGDLIDNAVDAIKARAVDKDDLSLYSVVVSLDEKGFYISDNGHGMDVQVARNTAFNFGKAEKHVLMENSIGQFGIGMKRAFFKIGKNISVHSVANDSRFDIDIDVPAWLVQKEWDFKFNADTLEENVPQKEATGFKVTITDLTDDAQKSFSDKAFITLLQNEIEYEHMLNINKGLSIIINGYTLVSTNVSLVCNEEIRPTYWENVTDNLSIKILAGISNKNEEEGGWYVFCNDRLILAKDKSANTVWTGGKGDGVALWHAQYHRFRGFVFLEAKDSSNLPWNTTKTGMDMDSPVYQDVRVHMILMTKQVMDLLDKLKAEKEKDNPVELQKLNRAIDCAVSNDKVSVLDLRANPYPRLSNVFVFPKRLYSPLRNKDRTSVQYYISKEEFSEAKSALKVDSAKEVGRKTFEYYCENELWDA